MKMLKIILFVIIIVVIGISCVTIKSGYDMYRDALNEMPLDKKIESIREKENYVKIEEVPRDVYQRSYIS